MQAAAEEKKNTKKKGKLMNYLFILIFAVELVYFFRQCQLLLKQYVLLILLGSFKPA